MIRQALTKTIVSQASGKGTKVEQVSTEVASNLIEEVRIKAT